MDSFADVGSRGREAVAAVDLVTGAVVGTARFVRDEDDPGSAEVAFEVIDDCQRHGVGRKLVTELSALARSEGIERFRAAVIPGNESAFALLRRAGRVVSSRFVDGVHQLVIELHPLARAQGQDPPSGSWPREDPVAA